MGQTVLVVDDEESVRELIARILSQRGYNILVAGRGSEALAISRDHPDRIDLLVTDVVMAETSGPELAARLIGQRPELKVLFVSSYVGEADEWRQALAFVPGFVEKPFAPDTLCQKVAELLDRTRSPDR
jgi:CheY-like chemotaxis protein